MNTSRLLRGVKLITLHFATRGGRSYPWNQLLGPLVYGFVTFYRPISKLFWFTVVTHFCVLTLNHHSFVSVVSAWFLIKARFFILGSFSYNLGSTDNLVQYLRTSLHIQIGNTARRTGYFPFLLYLCQLKGLLWCLISFLLLNPLSLFNLFGENCDTSVGLTWLMCSTILAF